MFPFLENVPRTIPTLRVLEVHGARDASLLDRQLLGSRNALQVEPVKAWRKKLRRSWQNLLEPITFIVASVGRGTSGLNATIFATSVVDLGTFGRIALEVLYDRHKHLGMTLVPNTKARGSGVWWGSGV
jgi:hypothetical protein